MPEGKFFKGRPQESACDHSPVGATEEILRGLDVLQFQEHEYDGGSGRGPKHWHRFDIIARQR